MKKQLLVAVLGVGLLAANPFRGRSVQAQRRTEAAESPGAAKALPSFGEPGISPDGSTIAFVSGGDIWEVPAPGNGNRDARLLVSHPATESRPLFSPTANASPSRRRGQAMATSTF